MQEETLRFLLHFLIRGEKLRAHIQKSILPGFCAEKVKNRLHNLLFDVVDTYQTYVSPDFGKMDEKIFKNEFLEYLNRNKKGCHKIFDEINSEWWLLS